jgi:hypothetical protein
MIQHVVLLRLPHDHDAGRLAAAMRQLAGLTGRVHGMTAFHHGPNADFENKSGLYGYGFVATFTGREAHLAYEAHPEHRQAGSELVAMCEGGYDGIFVADLDVAAP